MKLITPPSSEPISLSEAKGHLRVDASDEDSYISGLIVAARQFIELQTQRALITQTWKLSLDQFPTNKTVYIPLSSLRLVEGITYYDTTGATQTLPATDYYVDSDNDPGRVVLVDTVATYDRPSAVQIQFQAGYGSAADVPQAIKQAMLLLIGHWYENREAVGEVGGPIAFAVDALLTPYRVRRYV